MTPVITLAPLTAEHHVDPVQQVYRCVPRCWGMYDLLDAPEGQAERDMREAEETPGRTLLGIISRQQDDDPEAGFEMIGLIDFRLYWPREDTAYLGMLMVAESHQRQGAGTQALHLLGQWLQSGAGVKTMRLGVEQFNTGALQFFQHTGYTFTGETNRISVGQKWIRLLHMEKHIEKQPSPSTGQ